MHCVITNFYTKSQQGNFFEELRDYDMVSNISLTKGLVGKWVDKQPSNLLVQNPSPNPVY